MDNILTKEEAIKILEKMFLPHFYDTEKEAKNIAIQAIKENIEIKNIIENALKEESNYKEILEKILEKLN